MLHVPINGYEAIGERDVAFRNDSPLVMDSTVYFTLRLGQEVKVLGAHDFSRVVDVRRLTVSKHHVFKCLKVDNVCVAVILSDATALDDRFLELTV